jgi:lysine/ornithine N-monooxygenase
MGWVSESKYIIREQYSNYCSWCMQNEIKKITYTEFKNKLIYSYGNTTTKK